MGNKSKAWILVTSTFMLMAAASGQAQDNKTEETIADLVSELRVFLTDKPDQVIGELATVGETRLDGLSVVIEDGRAEFRDDGLDADKLKGDGIFTARFAMDTASEFEMLRADLKQTIEALRDSDEKAWIKRGPRDIVPATEAIKSFERKSPEALQKARTDVDRVARLLDFKSPLDGANTIGIDVDETPFLRLPGPRFDVFENERLRFTHLFDFPILEAFPPFGPPVTIDRERSLMVNNVKVVEDGGRTFDSCKGIGTAGGAWSFGHLMRELAHGTGLTPEDFTQRWLSSWKIPQQANGWIVDEPARGALLQTRIIDSWQQLSPGGVFKVDFFPARLLAIANRPDLADRIGYGTAGSAGEARLVFGLINKGPGVGNCTSLPFTVIFEYGIKGGTCQAVKAWHQRWKDLDQFAVGSVAYNQALELITHDFTDHGSNPTQLPNMSSLNQLRTNEIALGSPWQLREFRLQGADDSVPPGLFDLVTVKQAPDNSLNTIGTLRDYLGIAEADILADRHVVPERFPTVLDPFLGAVSNTDSPGFFWTAPNLNTLTDPAETRRKLSLGTCNACHGGETFTVFTHIGFLGTRDMGTAAELSRFLTGINVPVPVSGGTHRYEDLAERQTAMSNILRRSCLSLLSVRRLPFVH
jgi:hypothetical protein